MAIPGQRKPGQTGGWLGHSHNKAASRARGGSPRAGGGGRKPPKSGSGCAVVPFLLAAVFTAGGVTAWLKDLI